MSSIKTTEGNQEMINELFNHFISQAHTMKSILRVFRLLCDTLRIKPTYFPIFYPKLKSKISSWKASAIWAKLDKRSSHRCYGKGKIAAGQRLLVIGAGPCGLRTAIEAQLLGAKVIVIEKRDRFSRNNVLHLWPYNIADLRGIGAKKFYGKFCAGSIDHISIRQLQCILLKVCLLLGVEVFEDCGFESLIEPKDSEVGWRAKISPPDHPINHYEFDVLIGADGKRNTLSGFRRKEFRGKLAIAITANFINRHSEMESMVEEISGVAFIFNQKFFNDLNEAKGIDLENIVYYRDETHYFVMTAKKGSLLRKGVIINNEADAAKLLAPDNINQEALFQFAREAADYATNYKLPHFDFAVNHYGKPDVAMFDFTSMFQAENSSRIVERKGHRLLTALVGDSLLEPFWPTGTGCARGFFGGFDAIWMLRSLCLGKLNPLEVIAERESVYRVLAQTTPENTVKDISSYTLDPASRYTVLNMKLVLPFQVTHLYDTDDSESLQKMLDSSLTSDETPRLGLRRKSSTQVSQDTLFSWLKKQIEAYEGIEVSDMTTSFRSGLVLCAIIHRYRPDLIPDPGTLDADAVVKNNDLAFEVLERDLGIPRVLTGEEIVLSEEPDKLTMITYLSAVYEAFRRDVPAFKRKANASEDELDTKSTGVLVKYDKIKHKASGDRKYPTIGQLVAGEAQIKKNKKRRSGDGLPENPNKENSPKKRPDYAEIQSIKEEERFKIIEEHATGKPKKHHLPESVSKYRESKRPKELRRAIGKIDKSDWNLKNIEDKMKNKNSKSQLVSNKKDKVPKWSKAAFQDKFNIMKDKLENPSLAAETDGGGAVPTENKKYEVIDSSLARLQKKLREGSTLETGQRGSNKVSALASELFAKTKKEKKQLPPAPESGSKPTKIISTKTGSESCHFCSKRVYVVERMSAEGKFFHRSCFRCDYCNILLRLGSYVYKRDGPFQGKFFCLPHYTETYMEKYKYKSKAEEISEIRKKQKANISSENGGKKQFIDSLSPSHKERLFDNDLRGSTPERAEFEASIDHVSEEEKPSMIMDEDEWTDRNFGNSVLEDSDHTSDDSLTDISSDTESADEEDNDDDDENNIEAKFNGQPLTANEARQLQREWIKRYEVPLTRKRRQSKKKNESSINGVENTDNQCIILDEAKWKSKADVGSLSEDSSCSSDSDEGSATYDDGEYESDSEDSDESESESEGIDTRFKASVPPESGSSTEVGSGDLSSADDDKISEFFNSESNTECEFTDSEGRPNPFQREYESKVRKNSNSKLEPAKITAAKDSAVNLSKYKYKTPDISDRLRVQQQIDSVIGNNTNISSRRALNLKKNWAASSTSTSSASNATKKPVDNTEIDSRFKSLMSRLSDQQKLLKPANNAAPSKQMQHVLQSSKSFGLGSVPERPELKSSFYSGYPSVPFKPLESRFVPSSNTSEVVLDEIVKKVEELNIKPQTPEAITEECLLTPIAESITPTQGVNPVESKNPKARTPSPIVPEKEPIEETEQLLPMSLENGLSNIDDIPDIEDEEDTVLDTTPMMSPSVPDLVLEPLSNEIFDDNVIVITKEKQCQRQDENKSPQILLSEDEIKSPQIVLSEDEITNIYKETNPLEKIAKMNSYKQKQSDVIRDLIINSRRPQNNSSNKRMARIQTYSASSLPPPPPIPLEESTPISLTNPENSPVKNVIVPRLPATPITNPEKFGIPTSRSSKSAPGTPTRNERVNSQNSSKNLGKKSLMQSISGLFGKSKPVVSQSSSNSSSNVTSPSFKLPKIGLKLAPKAESEDDKLSPESSQIKFDLVFKPSHPSTPPIPLSRKIRIRNSNSMDDFISDDDEEDDTGSPDKIEFVVPNSSCTTSKILRRNSIKATRSHRLRRFRRAQEIQRQLEELDVSRKDLEINGVKLERRLWGEVNHDACNESDLMSQWFILLSDKNGLIRREQELLVMATQLELEDRSSQLEMELLELQSNGCGDSSKEGSLIGELLDISEKRESLANMLEKDKRRYRKEDEDIEAQMIASGLQPNVSVSEV